MKKLVVAILIILFSAQMFNKNVLLLNYCINTQVYLKQCINKNKPKLKCNGKCHLKKQMTKAQSSEQQQQMQDALKLPVVLFCQHGLTPTLPTYMAKSNIKHTAYYSNLYFYIYSASCIHPPNNTVIA